MTYYDFTHKLEEDISLFPGTPQPKCIPIASYEKDRFRETALSITSHTGTHIDAPAHMVKEGVSLDQMPITHFFGTAYTVDCSGLIAEEAIMMDQIKNHLEVIKQADYILFYTGWDKLWKTKDYENGYPYIAKEIAVFLSAEGKKGCGIDTLSVDCLQSIEQPAHLVMLGTGMILLENLCGLKPVCGKLIELMVSPLLFKDADGAPARVIGKLL